MEKASHSCTARQCRQADDNNMVSCDRCRRWWHYTCANFDPDRFDTATPWFCSEGDCKSVDSTPVPEYVGEDEQERPDLGTSEDFLIEAATVAQAAVLARDSKIAVLTKELEELKVKLSAIQTNEPVSAGKLTADKQAIVSKIKQNHQSLCGKKYSPVQSTPLRDAAFSSPRLNDSALPRGDMENLLTILNRNNIQELPSFSGVDRREWPYFEEVFRSTTEEGRFTGKENVVRLRKALKGAAYQVVSDRLKYSADADAIIDSLRAIFGRHDVLIHDLTSELLNLPPLSSKCDPNLHLWTVRVKGFVADVKSLKREQDLSNNYVLTSLACKLGAALYQEWMKRKNLIPNADISDFAEFLKEKLVDLPPELSTFTKSADIKKSSKMGKSSGRVLTHQPANSSGSCSVCLKCGQDHHLSRCSEFERSPADCRLAFAKEHRICFSCLDTTKHNWSSCRQKRTCGVSGCSDRHHPLLHQPCVVRTFDKSSAPVPSTSRQHIHSAHVGTNVPVLFKIAPIRVYGANGKVVDTYAFLDDGSSLSMMERHLFDELGLSGAAEDLTLQWTKGVSRHEDSIRTSLSVSGVQNSKKLVLKNVYTVRNLNLPAQSVDVDELQRTYPHLRGLPLTDLVNAKPKILVGLDHAKFLLGQGRRHGKDDEPCAIKTALGWVVFGKSDLHANIMCVSPAAKPSMHLMFHDAIKSDMDLHELVSQHFSTEDFGVKAPRGNLVSQEDSRAMNIMRQTLRRVENGYEIGLLWVHDSVKLPDSYPMALRRLTVLERSLKKRPHLLEWKNNHMRELVSKGYARIASEEELQRQWARVWYAPTFIVENPNKSPPKPRDVADVAAKVEGVSLNTFLLKGPDNLVPLHAGLFKFRERKVAVNADVKEMFHRIRIKEEDQQCQRFLWRNGDSSQAPTVFIMQVMMFGPRCSPTCAQFVKNYHAELFRNVHPEAVDGLTKRTYVDDYFNSHDSVEEAVAVTKDAIRICDSMNFNLVGVQSNSREMLEQIPERHINSKMVSVDRSSGGALVSKILGMFWLPDSDEFTYRVSKDEDFAAMLSADAVVSKRQILKLVMRIFDPLGLISFFVIRGRCALQEVWREGLDWDDPVPADLKGRWLQFVQNLKGIEDLRIPRRYSSWNPDDGRVSLVVFVDASERAFAAVAYLRFEKNAQVDVCLVMAKAKVAPVKKLTVPKLELQAAVLGVRLAATIKGSHTIHLDDTFFLSDSTTVLSWISSSKFKFPTFVAVRVGEILESSSPQQWRHVRSIDNVADDATRWSDPAVGSSEARWFRGPPFMKQAIEEWPVTSGKDTIDLVSEDIPYSASILLHEIQDPPFNIFNELTPRFQSSWPSTVRVIALLLRFKSIVRKLPSERLPFVSASEFVKGEEWLFRKIQSEAFPSEVATLRTNGMVPTSSKIFSLSPFLDEEGTIRLSGRGQKALVSYASRNPAILPTKHPLVDLFIQFHHQRNLHIGTETIISDIREHAWVISIRRAVQRVKANCNTCKRAKAVPVMPRMGLLPEARLSFASRPFTHVGVDCFGPLLATLGRSTVKRYGMIFTCLTFRAVHIELLNDLSLDQCNMALRRFIIYRVVTRYLYSDNGLNFVGTKNLVAKDVKEMEEALSEYASKYEGIRWQFIPAYSPWMGGAWERLIRSIKRSVSCILKGTVPREDVLRNALLEAQGQINRRPLTHVPVDPDDPKPLTPNLMLFGEDDRDTTAPGVFCEADACSRLYSRRSQHLMAQLVRRWYREYLPEITRRTKWHQDKRPVEVGQIVVLVEPNDIRSSWQLGRVVRVHPGQDGVVRCADVQTSGGTIKQRRAVGRLAILDLESSTRVSDGPRDVSDST